MITIKNSLRSIHIPEQRLKDDAQKILDVLGYSDFDLGILITTNRTIQQYNKKYRQKNSPTDILSFPFYPNLQPDEIIIPQSSDDKNLGDLILSAEYIKKKAQELSISFEQRLQRLLVHGICHLLGYDHITDEEYAVMKKKEIELLKQIGWKEPLID